MSRRECWAATTRRSRRGGGGEARGPAGCRGPDPGGGMRVWGVGRGTQGLGVWKSGGGRRPRRGRSEGGRRPRRATGARGRVRGGGERGRGRGGGCRRSGRCSRGGQGGAGGGGFPAILPADPRPA